VPVPVPALRDELTPNQLHKRRQIIDAAKEVLATQGLTRCTAREIAAAGPLTKSAIHYYFADLDLLIDLAMSEHVEAFQDQLRDAGSDAPDPEAAFWSTIDAYLDTFRDRPEITHLWFEYWTDASRKHRLDAVRNMLGHTSDVLTERLEQTGVSAAADKAHAVLLYLLGAIIDQTIDPEARRRTHRHIASLTGLT
jgi:DNA-binding transcriptional regulator YbjK